MTRRSSPTGGDLLAAGLLAHQDAAASVTEMVAPAGHDSPERLFHARVLGGFEYDVIASRGLDIGLLSYKGVPLSWISPVRDHRALGSPTGVQWLDRFNGGLLTTCGLSNIGSPRGATGMHGDFSHLAARHVSWNTEVTPDRSVIQVRGVIESVTIFGPSFRLDRTITSVADRTGVAQLSVADVVTNIGSRPAPFSLLYHLNFGAPLVSPGTLVDVASTGYGVGKGAAAVPDPRVLPEVVDDITEAVFEHHPTLDDRGRGRAKIQNAGLGLTASISWTAQALPHLYQWVLPTRGRWALGIEPANAPLFGPDRDHEAAGAPLLDAGQSMQHEVQIEVSEMNDHL